MKINRVLPWTVVLLAACGGDAPEVLTISRDSAGVAITESEGPSWSDGEAWRLGQQPTLQIGGGALDTTLLVGPVAGAFRLPDGQVLVADEGANALRWFTADGRPVRTVGRAGDGPGEFRDISRVLVVGDSLVIVDRQLRRASLLTFTGDFIRSFTLEAVPGRYGEPTPLGRLPDGRWMGLATASHSNLDTTGNYRDSVQVWMLDEAGRPERQVLSLAGNDALVIADPAFIAVTDPPFGRRTTVRFFNGTLWTSTGETFRIDAYDPSGALTQSVRVKRPAERLTPDQTGAARDSMLEEANDDNFPFAQQYRAAIRGLRMPATKPALLTFRLDDGGRLWVQHYQQKGSVAPSRWSVIDREGRLMGDVVMPPRFVPTHIQGDEIIGVWTDPDDVDHVLGYPLLTEPLAE